VSGQEFVIPPVLRSARFVRRQPGTRRAPMRVSPRAFEQAGLPVPDDRREWNIYRLTERQGEPWSPQLDHHAARFGTELLGAGQFVNVDCDALLAVDHTVWVDGFRRLADLAAESGNVLDTSGSVLVRTPGDPDRLHGEGWHIWWRVNPDRAVRFGPLDRCPAIEIKQRATAPGSPNYEVRSMPDELAMLPDWLYALAPPRPGSAVRAQSGSGAPVWRRLEGVIDFLRGLKHGDGRNKWLHWGGCRCGEMIAAGDLTVPQAEQILLRCAEANGYVAKRGSAAALAAIRSGIRTGVETAAAA
jgi:hypothetical protein